MRLCSRKIIPSLIAATTTFATLAVGLPAFADSASIPTPDATQAAQSPSPSGAPIKPGKEIDTRSTPRRSPAADDIPPVAAAEPRDPSDLAKKDRDKPDSPIMTDADRRRWNRELDGRIGQLPAVEINLYHQHNRETLAVPAGAHQHIGDALPQAVIDQFFRCHFTGQRASMDPRLVAAVVAAAEHFGVTRARIVSSFRSPKYNLILRKKGREVARDSWHTKSHAIDFRLPGVGARDLSKWAKKLRLGGVGVYPHSGFVHIDSGPIRYWKGR